MHAPNGKPKAHDTRSRNRRHKSTPFFWRRFLVRVSCKFGTGFFWYQIPAPIRTLFYSKPESGVHVTEMMTCDWSMITVNVLCAAKLYALLLFVYLSNVFRHVYLRRQKFSFQTYTERKIGAGKWSRFMAPVSGACVMGLSYWRLSPHAWQTEIAVTIVKSQNRDQCNFRETIGWLSMV